MLRSIDIVRNRLRGRVLLLLRIMFGSALLLGLAGSCELLHARPKTPPPPVTGLMRGAITLQGLERRFLVYTPAKRQERAPLLLLLHGSRQDEEDFRRATGYAFERLADEHGFLVVYPAAHRRRWNDCRAAGRYAARRGQIDDVGFVLAIIDDLQRRRQVDPSRVFVAGYSGGGHLAFRLATEHPERLTAIAAFGAHLPTPENDACARPTQPVSALLISGTEDQINPFEGGEVTVFGFRSRGTVLSAEASAERFARTAGLKEVQRRDMGSSDETRVEEWRWHGPGSHEVVLIVVYGGGHVTPGPHSAYPRILGKVSTGLDFPRLVWDFFARQPVADARFPGQPSP